MCPPGFPECEWVCCPACSNVLVSVLGLSTPGAGMDPAIDHAPPSLDELII